MSEMWDEGQGSRSDSDWSSKPTSGGIAREAAMELVGLEKRLPRTLWSLATRPGLATLQYSRGARNEQVSPVRLYIVVSTIYFAVVLLGEPEGLHLGVFTLTEVSIEGSLLRLPSAGHALILISAVPFLAACLRSVNGASVPYPEYLVFSLYFQSVALIAALILFLSPFDGPGATLAVLGYFVTYVGLSAQRLWGSGLMAALWLGVATLVLYGIGVAGAGLGATLLYNWLL